jgi:hypothetical protein
MSSSNYSIHTQQLIGQLNGITASSGGFSTGWNVSGSRAPITLGGLVGSGTPEIPRIDFMRDGGIIVQQVENGQIVKAQLAVESDITPYELHHVTVLLFSLMKLPDMEGITYIRKNSLERHFKFSLV